MLVGPTTLGTVTKGGAIQVSIPDASSNGVATSLGTLMSMARDKEGDQICGMSGDPGISLENPAQERRGSIELGRLTTEWRATT